MTTLLNGSTWAFLICSNNLHVGFTEHDGTSCVMGSLAISVSKPAENGETPDTGTVKLESTHSAVYCC